MKKQNGFTLVELLITIVIISILSFVAINQYRLSSEKSKLTEAVTLIKSIADANYIYYLDHKYLTADITLLDIEIPGGNPSGTKRIETTDFTYANERSSDGTKVSVVVHRKSYGTRYYINYSCDFKKEEYVYKYHLDAKANSIDKEVILDWAKKFGATSI